MTNRYTCSALLFVALSCTPVLPRPQLTRDEKEILRAALAYVSQYEEDWGRRKDAYSALSPEGRDSLEWWVWKAYHDLLDVTIAPEVLTRIKKARTHALASFGLSPDDCLPVAWVPLSLCIAYPCGYRDVTFGTRVVDTNHVTTELLRELRLPRESSTVFPGPSPSKWPSTVTVRTRCAEEQEAREAEFHFELILSREPFGPEDLESPKCPFVRERRVLRLTSDVKREDGRWAILSDEK